MDFDVESRLILKFVGGSHSYGTNTEDSDTDYRGIVIAPRSYYLGLDKFDQHETENPDVNYYNIRKYVRLALKANPNVLEYLFVSSEEYTKCLSYAQRLIDIREQFLTQRCIGTYIGYAKEQLRRLRLKSAPGSRTDKRMKLIEDYGYDTKYAMHLIRLLRTGKELLTEGKLQVKRPDAAELLDIRFGKFKQQEIEEHAEALLADLRSLEETGKSVLRKEPDYHYVNQILVDIVQDYLRDELLESMLH